MEIFETIRKDHEKQRLLMKILVQTSGDSEARREHFEELKDELKAHAAAEERHFYKKLMGSDRTLEQSRHGIHEHHEIDELIETLEETDMSSSAWLHYMKQLQEKVLHHLEEEEQQVFQQAGHVLSAKQKEDLAEDFEDEKQEQLH
ncbi:hemerythrin domain-containing protein [Planctobacterium marinum]|uniref:Hemerythrin n=1 Tax=Planctobacterium marinum TaxID=1631968 RepID=A0AA48HD38_9ALTE|nr:hemerythrin [Planctobacterium marinum]